MVDLIKVADYISKKYLTAGKKKYKPIPEKQSTINSKTIRLHWIAERDNLPFEGHYRITVSDGSKEKHVKFQVEGKPDFLEKELKEMFAIAKEMADQDNSVEEIIKTIKKESRSSGK
jgi:hypothetical protein